MNKNQLRVAYASMLVFALVAGVYAAVLFTNQQPVSAALLLVSALVMVFAALFGLRKVSWRMSKEPGRIRHTLNFLGITETEEDQRRRGSKTWWINRIIMLSFVMLFLFMLRLFNIL